VLKKDKKRMDKEREEISIEDLVEKERGNLGTTALTKVTLETFVAWKRKKMQQRAEQEKKEKVKKDKRKNPVLRIHDILLWIRIRGFMPLANGSGFGS
jgi:hypothetical protein